MLGYKIAGYYDKTAREWKPCMVFLEIPEDVIIVRPRNGKKLRCNKAIVLNIVDFEDRTIQIDEALSIYIISECLSIAFGSFFGRRGALDYTEVFAVAREIPGGTYRPDWAVGPAVLDLDVTEECASGIHFFLTEEDANEFYNDADVDRNGISWAAYVLLRATLYARRGALRPTESRRF